MEQKQVFSPPRKTGIFLHALLLLLLAGGVTVLMIVGFSQPADWTLVLYLIGALLLFALMPVIAYRGYALFHASYTLERDGLHVRWGLRSEDLPMTEVIWVRPASDLVKPLRLPPFSVPGAILGDSFHEELGRVEFIASSAAHSSSFQPSTRRWSCRHKTRSNSATGFNALLRWEALPPLNLLLRFQ